MFILQVIMSCTESVSWMPAKEDKGGAVLIANFLVKGITTADY